MSELAPSDQLSASFAEFYNKAKGAVPDVAAVGSRTGGGTRPTCTAQPGTITSQPAGRRRQRSTAGRGSRSSEFKSLRHLRHRLPPSSSGQWKSTGLSRCLDRPHGLQADGQFTWEVDNKGQKRTVAGQAGFESGTLALLQTDGPPLIGKITQDGANKFVFAPARARRESPGLTFTR